MVIVVCSIRTVLHGLDSHDGGVERVFVRVVDETDGLGYPLIPNPLAGSVSRSENQGFDVGIRPLPIGPDLAGKPQAQFRFDTTDNRAHLTYLDVLVNPRRRNQQISMRDQRDTDLTNCFLGSNVMPRLCLFDESY